MDSINKYCFKRNIILYVNTCKNNNKKYTIFMRVFVFGLFSVWFWFVFGLFSVLDTLDAKCLAVFFHTFERSFVV